MSRDGERRPAGLEPRSSCIAGEHAARERRTPAQIPFSSNDDDRDGTVSVRAEDGTTLLPDLKKDEFIFYVGPPECQIRISIR